MSSSQRLRVVLIATVLLLGVASVVARVLLVAMTLALLGWALFFVSTLR